MHHFKKKKTNLIAWILAIRYVPYIAIFCYIILKNRKNNNAINIFYPWQKTLMHADEKNNAIRMVLNYNNIPSATENNNFKFYINGIKAYQELIKNINNAKYSIYISIYVFKNDAVTKNILQLLTIKAKKGVEIKLLIDSVGSYMLFFKQKCFFNLRKAGGKVYFFMPFMKWNFINYINYRNHRKIFLFDHKILLTGGMNLGNTYLGPNVDNKRWNDFLFKIEGEAVYFYSKIFISDWQYTSNKKEIMMNINFNTQRKKTYGKNLLQVVPSGPDIPNDVLYDSLIAGIYSAKHRIWILTPYFIPSYSLFEAIKIAHYKGLEIKLILPKYSNHLIADLARQHYIYKLSKLGVKIYLFNKMIHAKAIIFDYTAVMLGSVNLDNRSLFLNYEIVTYAYEKKIIKEIEQWIKNIIKNSEFNIPDINQCNYITNILVNIFSYFL